mmetsp:Transcript_78006/g.158498  ORF Transcript_78006/g.158498 Transcript_78006/m.158498 type:complete len:83 (+) Transcript_78006:836-1084(+)
MTESKVHTPNPPKHRNSEVIRKCFKQGTHPNSIEELQWPALATVSSLHMDSLRFVASFLYSNSASEKERSTEFKKLFLVTVE